MPIPETLLTTPTQESEAKCIECGSSLLWSGKVATFSEGKTSTAARKIHRGWIPALLVKVCPTCDAPKVKTTIEAVVAGAATTITVKPTTRETHLERLSRLADATAVSDTDGPES